MTELRRRFPQIRSHRWLDGRRADGSYGVLWLTPAADEMKEQDWNFPEGRFLAYVLGPLEPGQAPIFIVLNAAPEAIAFKLPKMPEYKSWQQVLNTAEAKQTTADFASGAETKAPPPLGPGFCGLGMNERHIRRQADRGRRVVSAVGAGGQARRSAARTSRIRCGAATDGWFSADIAGVQRPARATNSGSTTRSTCPIRPRRFSPTTFPARAR